MDPLNLPLSGCPWSALTPSVESFCEERLCSWVVEPANTWSNLGYILVGLLILWSNRGKNRQALMLPGITAVIVGFGSTMFHATGSRIGEIVDLAAMFLISGLFVIFALRRLANLSARSLTAFYTLMTTSSLALMVVQNSSGIAIFTGHIVIATSLELILLYRFYHTTQYRNLNWMIVAFAVSYLLWYLDYHKIVCFPGNHILGGHALWHLINSTCLWNFYRYQEQFFDRRETANDR